MAILASGELLVVGLVFAGDESSGNPMEGKNKSKLVLYFLSGIVTYLPRRAKLYLLKVSSFQKDLYTIDSTKNQRFLLVFLP